MERGDGMLQLVHLKSVDFVHAMERLVYKGDFSKQTKKLLVTPSVELIEIVEKLETHVSMTTFEMLKCICEKYHLNRLLMAYVSENPEMTPEALVAQIKKIEPEAFYDLYIEKVLKPEMDTEAAIREKIDESYANNTTAVVMRYPQLKKFKLEAASVYIDFVRVTEAFLDAYAMVEEDVHALYDIEVLKFLEDMKDPEAFKSQFLMIDLNEMKDSIERMDISITIMGEFSIAYQISKDYRVLSTVIGFGMRKLFRRHDEVFELEVFKCLGDATKLKMIQLAAQEPLCAKDFTDRLGLSKATISHHINTLISLRIFTLNLQDGKKLYYVTSKMMLNRFWDQFYQKL